MTDTIRVGGALFDVKKPPTAPLRHLPNKMDAQACLDLLERIHPEWTAESIKAAGKQLDVSEIDDCLSYTSLGTLDTMTFKTALMEHGIISRGKRMS